MEIGKNFVNRYFGDLASAPWWYFEYFGNEVWRYALAAGIFLVLLSVFKIFNVIILNRFEKLSKKSDTLIDDMMLDVFRSIKPPFYSFVAFYLALLSLNINEIVWKAITALLILWIVHQSIKIAGVVIDYMVRKRMRGETNPEAKSAAGLITIVSKFILWVLGLLLLLSNLGVDITSLVAGLGIGGIAVALALQNILGDLFSSFAIYFDKPFAVGDFVIIGDKMGIVKKIGIKTTRLEALQGEEIVMANRELTGATIQNFKQMRWRRVQFDFGITYGTPSEKILALKDAIKGFMEEMSDVRFDRANLKEFGDYSFVYEVVYYLDSDDYNVYMDKQEELHLKISEHFEKNKMEFAFPTRTVHLTKN